MKDLFSPGSPLPGGFQPRGVTLSLCYELNFCVPPNSYVAALTPDDGIWKQGLWEVTRVREGQEGGAL